MFQKNLCDFLMCLSYVSKNYVTCVSKRNLCVKKKQNYSSSTFVIAAFLNSTKRACPSASVRFSTQNGIFA